MSRTSFVVLAVALLVGCARQPDGGNAPPSKAASPTPEPIKAGPANPAPTQATSKGGASQPPWARAMASPGDSTVSEDGWTVWFPCADPPHRQDNIILGGNGDRVATYTYKDAGTKYQLSIQDSRRTIQTADDAVRLLREHIDAWVRVSKHAAKSPPQASVVDGNPFYEVQAVREAGASTRKSLRDASAIWMRGTIVNGTHYDVRVEGPDPKAVFGKDAERFIRSLAFAKKAAGAPTAAR